MPTALQRFRLSPLLDRAIATYAAYTAVLILVGRQSIPAWPLLLLLHAACILLVLCLPRRGARWERSRAESLWRMVPRRLGVFLRHMYPLVLVLLFFEEGQFVVNGLYLDAPYWFEPYLYAADRRIFGDLPAVALASWMSRGLTELMHAFYFSYFLVLVFGPVLAARAPGPEPGRTQGFRGPPFESAMSSMILGFLCAFVWYPWIPARGPFENLDLMASLPRFEGGPLTVLTRWVTDGAAVSGNCFPSGHVAGTWGVVFGLAGHRRRVAIFLGLVAVGISVSCVYTRYHHGVDVPAGFLMGLVGACLFRLSRPARRETDARGLLGR